MLYHCWQYYSTIRKQLLSGWRLSPSEASQVLSSYPLGYWTRSMRVVFSKTHFWWWTPWWGRVLQWAAQLWSPRGAEQWWPTDERVGHGRRRGGPLGAAWDKHSVRPWRVQGVRRAQQACPIQARPGESRNPPETPPGRFLRAEAPRALPSSPAQTLEALHLTMTNSDLKMDRGRRHPTEMAAFLRL